MLHHEVYQRYHTLRQQLLGSYAAGEADQVARFWLEHVTQTDWRDWMRHPERAWNPDWEELFHEGGAALLAGQPVQHLMGYGYFYGRRFAVGPEVLIPRQETEELLVWGLEKIEGLVNPRLLDIGTGSGCLAVSFVLEAAIRGQQAAVVGMDLSEAALAVALQNADAHGVQIRWWHQDVFLADLAEEPPFDMIVSNPPYVTEDDRLEMSALVLDHEPALALFAPPEDALAFYRRITQMAREALKPGGSLLFEINAGMGEEVVGLLEAAGFEEVELRRDLQGRNRMVGGKQS